MLHLTLGTFTLSLVVLLWSGSFLMRALIRIAKFLGWREFVVAFLTVAFAGTLPNFLVGISSALRGVPVLSLGDVLGGNVVHLTLSIGFAAIIAGSLSSRGQVVANTALATVVVALMPLLLLADLTLSRLDGLILIAAFFLYARWLFSKKERFKQEYRDHNQEPHSLGIFMKDLLLVVFGATLLVLSADSVVKSAQQLALAIQVPIYMLGILLIGLGNSLPETYFAILSARKKEGAMVLGNLMGSIILPVTLVLGVVALIKPVEIASLSPFAITRVVLLLAALLFYLFIRTGQKLSRREGLVLVGLYLVFVAAEILNQSL